MHNNKQLSAGAGSKPEIITFYNSTKGAVDTLDQLLSTYSCRRRTNRWPMTLFYHMLDISVLHAFIIWSDINPNWNTGKKYKRRLFLEELGDSLTRQYISRRTVLPRAEFSKNIVNSIQEEILPSTSREITKKSTLKRSRCSSCPLAADRKTSVTCYVRKKYICKEHSVNICNKCL